jgi:DNA gyrase/topoisomerase IV subunit B
LDNLYKDDSIESLSPLEHVRLRPGMYAGDTSDATQLAIEILGNAIDEYNIGHGNLIIIDLLNDNSVVITDTGQGFPINVMREDGETVLQASFDIINTSGKYRDDGVYEGTAIGLNGIGAKLTNFLSHKLTVISFNNKGEYEEIAFKEGVFQGRNTGKVDVHDSGTTVSFQPSEEFFTSPKVNETKLRNFCEDITCLCPGLTIKFNGIDIKHDGIKDLLSRSLGNGISILNNTFIIQEQEEKQKLDLALTYCDKSSSTIVPYVNCGLTTAGPHITSIKSTITRTLNKWAKEQGILKEKDKNLEGSALQEGLVLVCNITAEGVAYDAQVKSNITKIDTSFISSTLGDCLERWLDNNPNDGKVIIEKALIARKAAEAAKKARAAVKANKTKKTSSKVKILHPDKLKDAEYLGEDSTLLIVEGLSAGASMAVARDREKYGILMLRGKLINAFSNSKEKLEKNEEIQLLLKALNITPGAYDPSDLRYGRVAIAVDADSDGSHIALLIATALQHFCPEFIEEQRLCWLRSPLYIVKTKQGEKYFFTDTEMDAARGTITGEVQRNKGLGSLSADQAKASMFGEQQRMDILNSTQDAVNLLKDLMGSSGAVRKEFVFNEIDFSTVRE